MASVWNLFSIGRQRRDEDQLTEMLVWLVDAVPEVGLSLLRLAFDDAVDGEFEVTTQHGIAKGRLDALFVGPTFALVVESKIDSGFGEDQITRYLDWLGEAHGHRKHRALMTLTAHPASWRADDIERARQLRIVRSERLWEELHELLGPLADEAHGDELAGRLVFEFLEMLSEEGLVPMKPLERTELRSWGQASEVVYRFHEYFFACRDAIGEALGARASSKSTHQDYVWQDYVHEDGAKIVVGLDCTDADRAPRGTARHTPVLWMAVEAPHWSGWEQAKERLEASVPDGWTRWSRWWGERPQIYRSLEDVIDGESFDEQRAQVAAACSVGTVWLRGANRSADREVTA